MFTEEGVRENGCCLMKNNEDLSQSIGSFSEEDQLAEVFLIWTQPLWAFTKMNYNQHSGRYNMTQKAAKLSDFVSSFGENTLHCPACDGVNLHQGRTEVFNRGEDANEGTHVVVEGDNVQTNRDLAGNPSGRRHGLTIHFNCENCPADVQMHIYQHKGNTIVGMEYQDGEA